MEAAIICHEIKPDKRTTHFEQAIVNQRNHWIVILSFINPENRRTKGELWDGTEEKRQVGE